METPAPASPGDADPGEGSSIRRGFFRTRARRLGALLFATLLVCAGLAELVCQLYWRVVSRQLLAMQVEPNYVYQASPNPILGYELRRSFEVDLEGKRLHLNRYGIREDSDDLFADRTRVALLGDSVLFAYKMNHVAVVVITGEGRAFSAGQDLAELSDGRSHEQRQHDGFRPFIRALESFPKLVRIDAALREIEAFARAAPEAVKPE